MSEESKPNVKYAVIRIRGLVRVKKEINHTMELMKLYRRNYCVFIDKKDFGMIKKVKDYVTYGEIDDATYKELIEKRGEEYKGREKDAKGKIEYKKFILVNGKKHKPFFRLSPPRKGFGRKGIKVSFKAHGALGYRADKINELIKRMI